MFRTVRSVVPALHSRADRARQAVLEEVATRLLARYEPPPGEEEYPCCSERRLLARERQGHRLVPEPEPSSPSSGELGRLCLRLLGRLPLDRRRRLIVRLRARGYDSSQIAALLGITPARVRALYRETCRCLREALEQTGEALLPARQALREAYRQDVARRGYTREKHCPPGREECRSGGLCSRRWYLYFAESQTILPAEGE